jgi:membrane-associated phospholipid phosphatase
MNARSRFQFAALLLAALAQPLCADDSNAGSWKYIVISGPGQFPVAPPAAVSDPAYQAELSTIRSAQTAITSDQRDSIAYWSEGGVLRWNEITLEMIARADLPPEPNADGTYPAPSAANPFAFPQYPFSNPPYAVRALSYLTVAQYEALKVAWYYKYLYNRPAPSNAGANIQALMPATTPGYPSEDGVEAGINTVLLKLLFPTNAAEIDQKVAQQQQAALLAGRASPSDFTAGFALGQAVAAVFVARAANDGMKNAAGTQAQWDALAAAATARGEIPWKSQETPPRPPMLPFFGLVQAWMMSSSDILNERPGPPPSTSSSQMKQETAAVKSAVANATRAQQATVYKWNDGVNSVTPPGHWDLIAQPYITAANFSEVRAARALALLNMALHDAGVACWDVKFAYFNPRPVQLDPSIRTIIGLPNFPSYTSGHSTFSAAAAEVLSYLFPGGAGSFAAQRDEAAMSRLYGGIHYPSDIDVGKDHGKRVGDYTVRFAQNDGAN